MGACKMSNVAIRIILIWRHFAIPPSPARRTGKASFDAYKIIMGACKMSNVAIRIILIWRHFAIPPSPARRKNPQKPTRRRTGSPFGGRRATWRITFYLPKNAWASQHKCPQITHSLWRRAGIIDENYIR